MTLEPAPFHAAVALAPDLRAFWLRTTDAVRIRIAVQRGGPRGTVLVMPGRTEAAEKYGITATELATRGFGCVIADWRGQGLSDRLTADPMLGHVADFGDYQRDVAAIAAAMAALAVPRPWFLLAHSMGGAIGLRALTRGLPVQAAAFSAPMWGLRLNVAARAAAWSLSTAARATGLALRYAPGTGPANYLTTAPAPDNVLTSDPEMFTYMQRQIAAHPDLALGGPSLGWVHAALRETRALRGIALPAIPALCGIGSHERVVHVGAIEARIAAWPDATMLRVEGAEHELLMETLPRRNRFLDAVTAHFTDS